MKFLLQVQVNGGMWTLRMSSNRLYRLVEVPMYQILTPSMDYPDPYTTALLKVLFFLYSNLLSCNGTRQPAPTRSKFGSEFGVRFGYDFLDSDLSRV